MDLPNAKTPVDIMRAMELEKLMNKPWHITASNAVTGDGLDEGMNWLTERLVWFLILLNLIWKLNESQKTNKIS